MINLLSKQSADCNVIGSQQIVWTLVHFFGDLCMCLFSCAQQMDPQGNPISMTVPHVQLINPENQIVEVSWLAWSMWSGLGLTQQWRSLSRSNFISSSSGRLFHSPCFTFWKHIARSPLNRSISRRFVDVVIFGQIMNWLSSLLRFWPHLHVVYKNIPVHLEMPKRPENAVACSTSARPDVALWIYLLKTEEEEQQPEMCLPK